MKGGGEKIKVRGFKKEGGFQKKRGNLSPFPPSAKTRHYEGYSNTHTSTHRVST